MPRTEWNEQNVHLGWRETATSSHKIGVTCSRIRRSRQTVPGTDMVDKLASATVPGAEHHKITKLSEASN
eukprot:1894734-Amphidinium_carterae.2